MSENKTKPSKLNPADVIASAEPIRRQDEARILLDLMQTLTGEVPVVWGDSIIGFGQYHYKYDSGREGDWFLTGFAPRKQAMSVYIMPGFKHYEKQLARLGPHRHSVSCLYISNLQKIDLDLLSEIIADSVKRMREIYA